MRYLAKQSKTEAAVEFFLIVKEIAEWSEGK